jgi:hypothetical protein
MATQRFNFRAVSSRIPAFCLSKRLVLICINLPFEEASLR